MKKSYVPCAEDNLCNGYLNKSRNLLGWEIGGGLSVLEDFIGGLVIEAGICIAGFFSIFDLPATSIGALVIDYGVLIIADANGLTVDPHNTTRQLNVAYSNICSITPSPIDNAFLIISS